ncbi:leucyl/phenylalanyl-tRNA--protein transferase [Acidipropionibacterium jensenii]|uniref:Leucyl/phenylalanyl-tRNA--protein transferase n=1 Tax=Acidipropionibacterium jensenii TaxID=1749 RepID=A0A3T0RWG7_9ACTN|nr:leucyl/phenylalanyl-tRNA--protein transferase [Acidipropionibacterium jensenii]AZZ38572.1 leucyl/phenylalanyl-tRNA--protein transferase [Acidipropionibacterium jensenii]
MTTAELFGDPDQWPDQDLVAISEAFGPHLVLAALREGVFPMPIDDDEVPAELRDAMGWWSPLMRANLPLDRVRVSSSLRKSARHYTTTVDRDFEAVIDRCADPSRPLGWIDDRIARAYLFLHDRGHAHSVETWDSEGRLVGGLYGVSLGGLFSGESMFHDPEHGRDASKTALIRLAVELASTDPRILDVQWLTDHLTSLGAVEQSREDYLEGLDEALAAPPVSWTPPSAPRWEGRQVLAAFDSRPCAATPDQPAGQGPAPGPEPEPGSGAVTEVVR